jgi:hypothetical protein
MHHTYQGIIDPLLTAIRRELAAIISRLHRVDFSKSMDPMAGMGGGPSLYMKDLVEKLGFVKREVLAKFNVGENGGTWSVVVLQSTSTLRS